MKANRTRKNYIKVYFNDEEYAELLNQVKENNISISELVRDLVLQNAK